MDSLFALVYGSGEPLEVLVRLFIVLFALEFISGLVAALVRFRR